MQRQGIINVAPKKRKNKLYLENWRPISLLNIDYKIISKAIANIRLIQDIMKITSLENLPGMAIFIDF